MMILCTIVRAIVAPANAYMDYKMMGALLEWKVVRYSAYQYTGHAKIQTELKRHSPHHFH